MIRVSDGSEEAKDINDTQAVYSLDQVTVALCLYQGSIWKNDSLRNGVYYVWADQTSAEKIGRSTGSVVTCSLACP